MIEEYVSKLLLAFRTILRKGNPDDLAAEHEALLSQARKLWDQMPRSDQLEADRLYFDGVRRITLEAME